MRQTAGGFRQGPGHSQTFTLGGITRNGQDATNELSLIFLEADRDIRLVQPDIAIRVHQTMSEAFLQKAAVNIREGLTKPKFMNDEVIIKSMLDIGMPLQEARDWGSLGCSEPVICGKTDSWGNAGQINLTKCLELALNDAKCMLTDQQMGPRTGEPEAFGRFEDLLEAFRKQIRYFVEYLVLYDNIIDRYHAEVMPVPILSVVVGGCLEKGVEFNRGGAKYNTSSPVGVGPITAGDSLAALKKLVMSAKQIIVRTPVIPGFNDSPEEIQKIARLVKSLGIKELHMLPYHRYGQSKYSLMGRKYDFQGLQQVEAERMLALQDTASREGLKLQVGG